MSIAVPTALPSFCGLSVCSDRLVQLPEQSPALFLPGASNSSPKDLMGSDGVAAVSLTAPEGKNISCHSLPFFFPDR